MTTIIIGASTGEGVVESFYERCMGERLRYWGVRCVSLPFSFGKSCDIRYPSHFDVLIPIIIEELLVPSMTAVTDRGTDFFADPRGCGAAGPGPPL